MNSCLLYSAVEYLSSNPKSSLLNIDIITLPGKIKEILGFMRKFDVKALFQRLTTKLSNPGLKRQLLGTGKKL